MKIPKIISKDNHEYILVKQCNENLWLYKDLKYGYKTTFTAFDLGLIKERVPIGRKVYEGIPKI